MMTSMMKAAAQRKNTAKTGLTSVKPHLGDAPAMTDEEIGLRMLCEELEERTLYLCGEVNGSVLGLINSILEFNAADKKIPVEERVPIHIMITSPGGDVTAMWSLIDSIKASKTPVYTVNLGECYSAASLIFMSGHIRLMLPSASLMIHEGSASIAGEGTQVINQVNGYKKSIQRMKAFVAANSVIPMAKLKNLKDKDWFLNASECYKYGVCDLIINNLDDAICIHQIANIS